MGIKEFITSVHNLVNYSVGLMVGLALLAFFWGIAKWLMSMSQGGSPDEGKNIMKWGLISLFVMVSIWGIIGFVQRAFELPNPTATQNLPSIGNPPSLPNLPSTPLNLPQSFEPFK